ncbi:MAG TPA: D-2-hydroxyacid dehydrogenase [Caulobacteraceae bacterium]
MARLLVFEPSFATIQADLAQWGAALEPLIMDRAGQMTLAGAKVEREAAGPEIAWFSGELYQQPAMGSFVGATLASPDLKWFQSAAAGFDHPIFARIAAKGARLTTSHGQAVGMADYVLAGVLDVFQRGPERRAAQARGEWKGYPFREVLGSTWLIVGFGAVGQGVAARARGFGARVIGVRRHQAADPLADIIAPLEALTEHLPGADVVVLCAPLNPATHHLANADFFAAMKPGSVLANVGRGALVDEAALLAALDRGAPAHAILDVFETEPLPADSPFWGHPAVSLSPHNSGVTGAQDGRNRDLFLDNLARYLDGRPLLNEIDPRDLEN